jgi:hypothetical protein
MCMARMKPTVCRYQNRAERLRFKAGFCIEPCGCNYSRQGIECKRHPNGCGRSREYGKLRCGVHLEEQRKYIAGRREFARGQGRCTQCRSMDPARKPIPGTTSTGKPFTQCAVCMVQPKKKNVPAAAIQTLAARVAHGPQIEVEKFVPVLTKGESTIYVLATPWEVVRAAPSSTLGPISS